MMDRGVCGGRYSNEVGERADGEDGAFKSRLRRDVGSQADSAMGVGEQSLLHGRNKGL